MLLIKGDDLGSYALNGKVMRAEQITSPSLAWLLPSPLFWKPDEILVQTLNRSYTMNQLEDFFKYIHIVFMQFNFHIK